MQRKILAAALLMGLAVVGIAYAGAQDQDLKSFEQKITTKVLPNGLTLIICERPDAPVFSYTTFVDAGRRERSLGRERPGPHVRAPGLQGNQPRSAPPTTPTEKVALEKVEAANKAYEAEYLKPVGRDDAEAGRAEEGLSGRPGRSAQIRHPQPVHRSRRAQRRHDLNAETGLDDTQYFWSMPENRLELWAWLESSRLSDVVPARVLQGARRGDGRAPHAHRFRPRSAASSSSSSPPPTWPIHYGRSGIGWPSEVSQINATEAMAFHKKYYVGVEHRGRRRRRCEGRRNRCPCWRSISAACPPDPSRKT